MSLVKWVDGYYDNKADVPLEKIGDGKDLEFFPLAVVTLKDLREVVDGLKLLAHGKFNPSSPLFALCMNDDNWWEQEGNNDKEQWLAQHLLAQLKEV